MTWLALGLTASLGAGAVLLAYTRTSTRSDGDQP